MRRRFAGILAAAAIASLFPGVAAARGDDGARSTYLALGTSIALGYQPGKGPTDYGYVDILRRSVRRTLIPGLGLHNLGCPGETSWSMLSGKGSECRYAAGSQLDAAVAFLRAHPGNVAFITVEVGANDLVARCLDSDTGLLDATCAADLFPRLRARLTMIGGALRGAAGSDVPIVAMTYYDPFLGLWGVVRKGRAVARQDQRVWASLNAQIEAAFEDAGANVADVARMFRVGDFEHTHLVPGRGRIPLNVALACRWTWFCTDRSFGDPHPNQTGYRKIAHTFRQELEPLLS